MPLKQRTVTRSGKENLDIVVSSIKICNNVSSKYITARLTGKTALKLSIVPKTRAVLSVLKRMCVPGMARV